MKNRKAVGGMGFCDLIIFNRVMLGKQAWCLLQQPQSLWSSFFKGLYFHSADFLSAAKGSRPSWGWQSLLMGRDAILQHTRWSVGNGNNIRIRGDRWLPMGILHGPNSRDEPLVVADLIDQNHHNWN